MRNNVKEQRKFFGMSQQELADKSNCGKTTIGDIERGNHEPKVRLAIRIAKTLHTTVEALFGEDEDETDNP